MVATITVISRKKYASNGFISVGYSNGCFNVNFSTDIQLIPVRQIGLILQGFSYIAFATDIQPITIRKMITFITENCFPEACRHHKCPMGGGPIRQGNYICLVALVMVTMVIKNPFQSSMMASFGTKFEWREVGTLQNLGNGCHGN